MSERLHETYKAAEDFGLYVQLHAGMSNLLPTGYQTRRHAAYAAAGGQHFGLFDHYCDEKGRSRLFESYGGSFVLAHMGSYGVGKPDHAPIVRLAERYPHVFFDTSNCPPPLIADFTRALGASRLIFGSDGLYNRQVAELVNCLDGLERGSGRSDFEENAAAVLGHNFVALRRETSPARSSARSQTFP